MQERFREVAPSADFWSFRMVSERNEMITVRQDILQPVSTSRDVGVMVSVVKDGGAGYAATSDLSKSGLRDAVKRALDWAERTKRNGVVDFTRVIQGSPTGEYLPRVQRPWSSVPLGEKIDLLRGECARLKTDERIVDWSSSLWHQSIEQLLVTSGDGLVRQAFELLMPDLSVTANQGSETVTRSNCETTRQGGLEILEEMRFTEQAPGLSEEVLTLLVAPNCPTGKMDILLDPTQMFLQIHESIGHPVELDRILGDERNYAGTSFVTPDMIGSYRYGSDLLNITFDPSLAGEFASYTHDDDGTKAEKQFVIKNGILERALGGAISQSRAELPGVSCSRACSWNRPPIDRMANLNLEPGTSTFDELVASIENGVFMAHNNSWSIDDSRNKFQFGCEYGRRIENGELGEVVKKPNYKGISATFWRNLKGVGDRDTFQMLGTPHCGKGEPNQAVRVGHASPACVFTGVDVFGGE
jgi:predicted Zn-dependent protease